MSKTQELVQLHERQAPKRKPRAGRPFCPKCNAVKRLDGITLQNDGTATCNACGTPVEATPDPPATNGVKADKPAKVPSKRRKAAKGRKRKPEAPPKAKAPVRSWDDELQALREILDRWERLTPASRGWLLERLEA